MISVLKQHNYLNLIETKDKIYSKYCNLAPLKQDTVSFGAKKSQFSGIDLLVVNQFFAPYECKSFSALDDKNPVCALHKWCSEKIEECRNRNYYGRTLTITDNRNILVEEWCQALNKNKRYNDAARFFIIRSITSDLDEADDKMPPVFNEKIVDETMTEIEENSKKIKNYKVNFNRLYDKKLKKHYLKNLDYTGWIIIPSKSKSSNDFQDDVCKLKVLSHHNWCTKSFKAQDYLSQGSFHIYMENGKPKLGIRFIDNEIQEIQGKNNNLHIPFEYLDIAEQHTINMNMSSNAATEFENTRKAKAEIDKIQKKTLKPIKEISNEELFEVFNMLEKRDETDGKIILKSYSQPKDYLSWIDLEIDENKLFKDVKEIKGNAYFNNSKITDLQQLKRIGAHADFENSCLVSLGELQEIGGDTDFFMSEISDLGKLKQIGGNVNFSDSNIKNLGELEKIGGDAYFSYSVVNNLGKLKEIGNTADFSYSKITNLKELEKIGGDAVFSNSKVNDLGKLHEINGSAYILNSFISKEMLNAKGIFNI